jgi:DNA-binding transcriptional MerR regulator
MAEESIYSPAEVCEKLGISKSTLFRWEDNGYIPAPDRNLRGDRCYTQLDLEDIARFVQLRRHRQRYAQVLAEDNEDTRPKLEELGEQNALFKFVNLRDPTGLAELREYSPLQPSTICQLLKVAVDNYDPSGDRFWDIIDVVCETSRPKKHATLKL